MIEVTDKRTLSDHIKLIFILLYRKPAIIFMSIIGLGQFIGLILSVSVKPLSHIMVNPIMSLVIGILFVIVFPISVFHSARKGYQEGVLLKIDEHIILVQRKASKTEYNWSNITKILKLKNWILLYKNKSIIYSLPISSFNTPEDIKLFWDIVSKNNTKIK